MDTVEGEDEVRIEDTGRGTPGGLAQQRHCAHVVSLGSERALHLTLAAVAVMAMVVRSLPTILNWGWLALGRYDDGVYLGMSMSLLHGEMPYRDLIMLHPPGSTLMLMPLAALSTVLPDNWVMVLGRASFMLLGAATAAGVAYLVRDRGRAAMWAAGGTYAVFVPAAYADSSITLECLSSFLVVAALLSIKACESPRPSHFWIAGAFLGLATTVKIWGVLPLVIIVLWTWRTAGVAQSRRLILSAFGIIALVCLPFFISAPSDMWRMAILDQIGRPNSNPGPIARLPAIFGLPKVASDVGGWGASASFAIFATLALALAWVAFKCIQRGALLPAAMLVLGTAVLATSPSHFLQYGAFIAVPLAWCVGSVARGRAAHSVLVVLGATSLVGSLMLAPGSTLSQRFVSDVNATNGCLASDDPGALIVTNTLSRNLKLGCPTWIDVTGATYDIEGIKPENGVYVSRTKNPYWQYGILGPYLEGSSAFILGRPSTGASDQQKQYWKRAAETTTSGRFTLYKVTCPGDSDRAMIPFSRWAEANRDQFEEALQRLNGPCG